MTRIGPPPSPPVSLVPNVLELHMTETGCEALHAGRERVEPIERRVFGAFSPKDLGSFREFLSRFIEAFGGGNV